MALIGVLIPDYDDNVKRPCPWSLTISCNSTSAVKVGRDRFDGKHLGYSGDIEVECYKCRGCNGVYRKGEY